MRGTTLYDRRGMPLVLPKGNIQNPSLRFWKERTGLYLGDEGVLGVTLKTYKAFELTEDGASIHAQTSDPGHATPGHVTPLSLVRVNATWANDQETQTDYYETVLPIARTAVYVQSITAPYKYGFKWYGFNAGLHATPAMTLSGDKDLTVGRDLIVTRNVIMSAGGLGLAPTAHNTGLYLGADAFTPSIRLGNDDVETNATNRLEIGLNVGAATLGGVVGDAVLRTVGTSAGKLVLSPNGTPRLTLATDGAATFGGPSVAVSPATGPASLVTVPLQANQNSHLILSSNTNTQLASLTLQGGPAAFPAGWGAEIGDVSLYANVGALRLGAGNAPRLEISAAGIGTYRLAAGANNLFRVLHSSGTPAVFSVTDAGAIGLQTDSVDTPQLKNNSVTAAKLHSSIAGAYLPLTGGVLSGKVNIDEVGAASAGDYQNAGLEIRATGGIAGIGFHRPGQFGVLFHESAGHPRWGADLMWTDANVGAAQINAKLGYAPVSRLGDTMTGRLTLSNNTYDGSQGFLLAAGGGYGHWWVDSNGWSRWVSVGNNGVCLMHNGSYFMPPGDQYTNLGHPSYRWGNFYAVNGTFYGGLSVVGAITTSSAALNPNLNAQYLNGKTDVFLVPSGMRAFFVSSAMPAGWQRETNADGRVIAGSGASFSGVTFGENQHNGSNTWTPAAGVGVNVGTLKTVANTVAAYPGGSVAATSGGLNLDPLGHTHAIPILSLSGAPALTGTAAVWIPPTFCLVMAFKQ